MTRLSEAKNLVVTPRKLRQPNALPRALSLYIAADLFFAGGPFVPNDKTTEVYFQDICFVFSTMAITGVILLCCIAKTLPRSVIDRFELVTGVCRGHSVLVLANSALESSLECANLTCVLVMRGVGASAMRRDRAFRARAGSAS